MKIMQFPSTPFFLPLVGRVSNNKRWQIFSNDYSIFVPIPIFLFERRKSRWIFCTRFLPSRDRNGRRPEMVGRRNPPGIFKTDTMARRITVYIYIFSFAVSLGWLVRVSMCGEREEKRKEKTRPGRKTRCSYCCRSIVTPESEER